MDRSLLSKAILILTILFPLLFVLGSRVATPAEVEAGHSGGFKIIPVQVPPKPSFVKLLIAGDTILADYVRREILVEKRDMF